MPILAPNFFICVPILDLSDARTVRLRALFEDPTTELHLMFMSSFLINLTRPNLFLQQAEPQIHHVFETIHTTVQNILRRFARVKEVDEYDVDDMESLPGKKQTPNHVSTSTSPSQLNSIA